MFGLTLLLLTDVGTEVPHYRPRLRFAGNRDGQWKSHAVDHPRLIGSKVGLTRNPVYLPCTSVLINRSPSLKWPRFEFSPTGLGSVSACLSMSSQRSNFMVTVVSTTEANTSLGR